MQHTPTQSEHTTAYTVPALIGGWGMAGMMGITIAVTVALRNPFDGLPVFVQAMLGIIAGWAVLMLCAPWPLLRRFRDQRRIVRRLAAQLEAASEHRAAPRLPEALCNRRDELGRLARATGNICGELDACRQQRRALQRSMHDRIHRETRRATAHLHQQASTDPLTRLENRRGMNLWLGELFAERASDGAHLVVMTMDIDLFKPVNDTLGHEAGDMCLRFLGELLRTSIRAGHCAARVGGDEFLVFMTDVDVDEARVVASRVTALFRQMPWPHRSPARPTLSIGLAVGAASDHDDAERLIRAADEALYTSKRNGRARTTVHRHSGACAELQPA